MSLESRPWTGVCISNHIRVSGHVQKMGRLASNLAELLLNCPPNGGVTLFETAFQVISALSFALHTSQGCVILPQRLRSPVMRLAYLLSILFVISTVGAERLLLASTADPYGIVAAAQSGNETAAVFGFTQAGNAADVTSAAAALTQIFNTVSGT